MGKTDYVVTGLGASLYFRGGRAIHSQEYSSVCFRDGLRVSLGKGWRTRLRYPNFYEV